MHTLRMLQRAFFLVAGLVLIAVIAIGCESAAIVSDAPAMGSAYVSTSPLRADQIVFRGPLTIEEYNYEIKGFGNRSAKVLAGDPLVAELNEWARQHLVGATATLVDYAPRLHVLGENFSLDFLGTLIVINLWEGRKPAGQWSIAINTVNDPILAKIKARLAPLQP